MKRLFSILLIPIVIFCNGCIEEKSKSSFAVNRNYIVYNYGKLPDDLVMLNNNDIHSKDILCALFEGLVRTNEENKIVPALAESYTISDDKICYTFKIRQNAKWSDGTKITAQDFVNCYKGILDYNSHNIYASDLYYVFGVKDYIEKKRNFDTVAIRALNESTLEIRLNSPCEYFLDILCNPVFSLRKIDKNLGKWKEKYNEIKYSGAFDIKNISSDNNITITKNDNYWNKDNVESNKIVFTDIESGESALADFNADKIDIFTDPPNFEMSDLISKNEILCEPKLAESMIIFNLKNNDNMNNSNLRKSIADDIDRSDLIKEYSAQKLPALGYIPSYIRNSVFDKKTQFFKACSDIEKSKKELLDSNFDIKNRIRLVYLDESSNKKDCDDIADTLKKDLGLKIEAKGYSSDELNQIIKEGNYDIIKTDFTASFNDAYSYLQYFSNENSNNIYGYSNNEYNILIYEIKLEQDNLEREKLMIEAEKMLMDDMPLIPLYNYNTVVCSNNSLKNIYITKSGNVMFDKAYRKASI